MAFRSQAVIAFLAVAPLLAQQARWEGVRARWWKNTPGTLEVNAEGIAFTPGPKSKQKPVRWAYADIQQLRLSEKAMEVLTYRDRLWLAGSDQPYRFRLPGKPDAPGIARELARKLDQRFIVALADPPEAPLWALAVKNVKRLRGTQGELLVGADRVVYRTSTPGASRTWRYQDLDTVSRSGPFTLTVTTLERALTHYGSRQDFEFQLKEPLSTERYDDLWRRIEEKKQ